MVGRVPMPIASTIASLKEDNTECPIVFKDVAPVVPVRDLQAALERYRRLGFEVRAYGHGTGYGYAQRGAVSIHLSEWDEHDPKRTGAVVYLSPATPFVDS